MTRYGSNGTWKYGTSVDHCDTVMYSSTSYIYNTYNSMSTSTSVQPGGELVAIISAVARGEHQY
jgi:hypothetical protein